MEINFQRPLFFLLLLILPALVATHFFVYRTLKKRAFRFANFDAIKRITGRGFILGKNKAFISKNLGLLVIRLLALFLVVLATAGPVFTYKTETLAGSFVIALDASSSMLADDFEPNRFEAAKDAVTIFLTKLKANIKTALITFTGVSYIESPLTNNKNELVDKVSKLEVKRTGGTDLTEAIITSVNLLENEPEPKTIILITDGRSTVGSLVEEAIQYAKEKHVIVHTIGMATKSGGHFLNLDTISTLDEPTLLNIANETQGRYFKAANPNELADKMLAVLNTSHGSKQIDFSWYALAAGIFVLLIEWLLSNTVYRSIP